MFRGEMGRVVKFHHGLVAVELGEGLFSIKSLPGNYMETGFEIGIPRGMR